MTECRANPGILIQFCSLTVHTSEKEGGHLSPVPDEIEIKKTREIHLILRFPSGILVVELLTLPQ
jgi:hypothetical protein